MFDTDGSLANPVLGVDACKSGWVGVRLGDSLTAHFAQHIADLVDETEPAVVAIDIPIGLPEATRRQADELGRQFLRNRASSLFTTPVRAALEAETHELANAVNQRLVGQGISIQAYSLRASILQVDAWLPSARCPVIEVHPEMSFAQLAGGVPLPEPKKTWAGAERRRGLLAAEGITFTEPLGVAGMKAGVDDVLDAAAAAWTARRYLAGTAVSVPDPPERFGGREAAIWR